jgi:hypothetical protein
MNWKQTVLLAGTLAFGAVQAEEPKPTPQPMPAQLVLDETPQGNVPQKIAPVENGGAGRRVGGFGRGGYGQNQTPVHLLSRIIGITMDDANAEAHIDSLPYGIQSRFVKDVPVGGVENFQPISLPMGAKTAWKVEQLYKLTFEQSNALTALRDEYKKDIKKYEEELLSQQKAIAAKVQELRSKYESRANDVLTGIDKENKQKIDAITQDSYVQNAKLGTDLLDRNKDAKEFQALYELSKDLREKISANADATSRKIEDLVSPEGKALLESTRKQAAEDQEKRNQQMKQWREQGQRQQGKNKPDGGGNGTKRTEPVTPPAPPEKDGNF